MQESYINTLLKHHDIVGSIGIFTHGKPECSLPAAVRIFEGWVDRMEFVMVQWIINLELFPVFPGGGDLC